MKHMLRYYLATFRVAILEEFQYQVASYFYMIGMIAEPVIYLVVWSSIAEQQGGVVAGYTAGGFAAYYIVWTLVRNMNIAFTPYGWEWRIQRGRLSMELIRPLHPLNGDVAYFAGMKIVMIVLWLPIALLLVLAFKPELHPTWFQGVAFFFSIWFAFLIRTMFLSLLGMISFWTTRVGAIYETYFALELILSGRLVPMTLMPEWVQRVAVWLPFQWTFYFPINALTGSPTPVELLSGLGIQCLWFLVSWALARVVWHFGIKQYSAVGS